MSFSRISIYCIDWYLDQGILYTIVFDADPPLSS